MSAPVPFPFLWTLDFELGTWIWNLDWDLDLELGFGTGLGLDNLFINRGTILCSVSSPRMTSNDLEACTWEHLHGDLLEVAPPLSKLSARMLCC